jgi:hypothetical protein
MIMDDTAAMKNRLCFMAKDYNQPAGLRAIRCRREAKSRLLLGELR